MSDDAKARRQRGQRLRRAEGAIKAMEESINFQNESLRLEDIAKGTSLLEYAKEKLESFADAVTDCQVIEEMNDDEADLDVFMVKLEKMEKSIMVFTSQLKEKQVKIEESRRNANASSTEVNSVNQSTPRTFQFSHLEDLPQDSSYRKFREWQEAWFNNAKVYKLEKFEREVQVYSLLTALGPHATKIVKTHLNIQPDVQSTTVNGILDSLKNYYRSQRNVAVDRVALHRRTQHENETFDEFRFSLDEMAEDATLCEHCKEDQIVTQIMVGTKDEEARRLLLEQRTFPTLKQTIEICQAREIASNNQAILGGREVYKVSNYKSEKSKKDMERSRSQSQNRNKKANQKCGFCGYKSHPKEKCPARNQDCRNCRKRGHFEKCCRLRRTGDATISSVFVGHIKCQ